MIRGVLWRADEHEELTARAWRERDVREAIEAIVLDAEGAASDGFWPGHPLDDVSPQERFASLYLGSAGMIWALWRLGGSLDCPAALDSAIERYRAEPDFGSDAHPPSLWMGETGLLVVADMIESPAADRERLRDLVRENRAHPTWELMWGSPGTMLAARACDLQDVWEDSARALWAAWDDESDLWTQHLYGEVKQYLGPAHGFAGNAHALRGYVSEDPLRDRVTRLLERTAQRDRGLTNWLPSLSEPVSKVRVQWCHGAPGIIAGPLRKGPGLCHGTAGNGFAFLKLHQLTGDERWLDRARHFAMHAIQQVERERHNIGRGRYTLWTGDIGVALYLRACIDADVAFPTIDTF